MTQRVIRIAEAAKKLSVSKQTIWRLSKSKAFPQKIRLSDRAVGFFEHEIDQFLKDNYIKRGGVK